MTQFLTPPASPGPGSRQNPPGVFRLMLLRHAHASSPAHTRDYDRPLSAHGEQSAHAMGGYMAQEGLLPALALVSGARRTRHTWDCVQKSLPGAVPAVFDDNIYEAGADALASVVRAAPASSRCVLLVGHNPGIHELAVRLVGWGGRAAYARLRQGFAPGSLAVIDFEVAGWERIAPEGGVLERFAAPDSGV